MRHVRNGIVVIGFMTWLWGFANYSHALEQEKVEVNLESGTKTIQLFSFHPSEGYMLEPAVAHGKVGETASLQEIAEQSDAVAAINGTYFNAYDEQDLQPFGAIVRDREVLHMRGGVVAMGISPSGELVFDSIYSLHISGTVERGGEHIDTWHAGFVNHLPSSDQEIVLFTPDFRNEHLHLEGYQFIVVRAGNVVAIEVSDAYIPEDGFVIAYGPWYNVEKFQIGDAVTYKAQFENELSMAQHLMSLAPKLLTDGELDVNFERDRVSDPKMTTLSAMRSFIGSKPDGTIVFGTARNVTLVELATLLKQLGLQEAINLDGGASSGLYVDGHYVTVPGREISNALIVVSQPYTPRILINDEEQFFQDAHPFFEQDILMLPLRNVVEKIDAQVEWTSDTHTATVTLRNKVIQLQVDSEYANVNGEHFKLQHPFIMRENRLYISLDSMSEVFGMDVSWDSEAYLLRLDNRAAEAATIMEQAVVKLEEGHKADAISLLQEVVEIYPDMDEAWLKLGQLYMEQEDVTAALNAYRQVESNQGRLALGWTAYEAGELQIAIEAFDQVSRDVPSDRSVAEYGLALVYRHEQYGRIVQSNFHLRRSLELDVDNPFAEEIKTLLDMAK